MADLRLFQPTAGQVKNLEESVLLKNKVDLFASQLRVALNAIEASAHPTFDANEMQYRG